LLRERVFIEEEDDHRGAQVLVAHAFFQLPGVDPRPVLQGYKSLLARGLHGLGFAL
jgi:hypothetical protein